MRFLQEDYRRHAGRYDRIVSIGMFEHVGPRNYRAFFDVCHRRLAPDGLMLHQTISSQRQRRQADPWLDRYIFPGGVLPALSQIAASSEPRWVTEDVHGFGPDYDRTLMAWHANIEQAWDELPSYDERFRRTRRYYLLSAAAAFRVRRIGLLQLVFRRAGRPLGTYQGARAARDSGGDGAPGG